MHRESEKLSYIISELKKVIPFPKRYTIFLRGETIDNFEMSLEELAEERQLSAFYFVIKAPPIFEIVGEHEEIPENVPSNSFSPLFEDIKFLNRFKGRFRILDEESPCFNDEFIAYHFLENADIGSRFWIFLDHSTRARHPYLVDNIFFGGKDEYMNRKLDFFDHVFEHNLEKKRYEYGYKLADDIQKVFSTINQDTQTLARMFDFRCELQPSTIERRYDRTLFQIIKTRVALENYRVIKLENLSGIKLNFERASLEYFILLRRGEDDPMTGACQPLHRTSMCAEIATHEKNILQSIVLYTNDWLSIVSARLVSRVWHDFLSNDNNFSRAQLLIMARGGEEMLDYMKTKIERVYHTYELLQPFFSIEVQSLKSDRHKGPLKAQLHWSVEEFLKNNNLASYQVLNAKRHASIVIPKDQKLSSFYFPDYYTRVIISDFFNTVSFI